MDKEKKSPLSPVYLGEFRDQELEKEFYNAEMKKNIKYVKFTLLVVGFVYFLFIIPEYYLITDMNTFIAVLINRSVIFALMMLLYFKVKRSRKYYSLIYWFTTYEILISLSFLYISNKFTDPDLLIQAFGVMIIILAIFLINNRWRYSILTSLFIAISYFVFVAVSFTAISFAEFSAAIVHILIVIFLSSISSYSINYYKRIQYLDHLELIKMAENDSLTGIYNKAKFNQEYARLADCAKANNAYLSLVIFDVDNLKEINDQYGHLVGDSVLIELTEIVRRNIDISDIYARWGGDEFGILFPEIQLQRAIEIVERLRKAISEHSFKNDLHLTCCFGVADFKTDDNLNTVLKRADERLYRAKNSGRNRVM